MLRQVKQILDSGCPIPGKPIFLCLLSALLLILSFPRSNVEFLAWFGFVPLFFALKNKSNKRKAFLLGYLTGIAFWLGTIYWLIHVTVIGMILLVLYLALYFGLLGLIVSGIQRQESRIGILFIPSVWVILEYLRAHFLTGFPWALLGYSQFLNLPFIQIADITGAWGVSFAVMMINVSIFQMLDTRYSMLEKAKKILIPVLCLMVIPAYGYYHIYRESRIRNRGPFKVSLIQGNIPQELKWEVRAKEFIFKKFLGLTAEAAKEKTDLFIWPEAALPVVLEDQPEYFERVKYFIKSAGKPLLLGAVTIKDNSYYNSAIFVSKEGEFLKKYDKIHLVPFGEYIPLRKTLPFLEAVVPIGDFSRGKEFTLFPLRAASGQNAQFGTLICFEDVFPELSREFVKKGADFLVNITNDAWFEKTSAPYQHLQASVMRAVENRIPLVRSANTGVSAFIAASGKILNKVENGGKDIYIDGYKTAEIHIAQKKPSFYTRHGDIFIVLCLSYALLYLFIVRRKRI